MFRIVADSCCDIPGLHHNTMNIRLVPLKITIDGVTYIDDGSTDSMQLINAMKGSRGAPSTACPSPGEYADAFNGDDDVFVVTLSSHLSGSYQSAMTARELKTGSGRVHVFDSKSASAGEVRIVLEIIRLIEADCSYEEIIEQVTEFIKNMTTLFVLQSLDNLIKAGRMNRLVGQVATFLHMRPIMGADDGQIALVEKARGTQNAMRRLAEIIAQQVNELAEKGDIRHTLVMAECNCTQRAHALKDAILEKTRHIRQILVVPTGGLSTTYANDGGIVIGY